MPKLKINEPWVNGFKTAIRESTAKGWSVREHRGQARLEVRTPDGMKSAQLLKNNIPFSYTARDMADILIRVRHIYVEMSKNGGDFDSSDINITDIIDNVLSNCQNEVLRYKNGEEKLIGFFIGQVNKETKGKVSHEVVIAELSKKLKD